MPVGLLDVANRGMSLPSRGAWIEILASPGMRKHPWSLPSRGAWIEILYLACAWYPYASLPSRGAWIEMLPCLL